MTSILSNPTAEGGRHSLPPTGDATMASYPARALQRPPSHPGACIADILEDKRISLRTAAKAIGMSPTGLGKVLRGESPVTAETAWRIAAYFRPTKKLESATPELWLRMQASHDLWHARQKLESELAKIELIEPRAEVA